VPGPRPLWRHLFDLAERTVGAPLEASFESSEFMALVSTMTSIQRSTNNLFEAATTAQLHVLGLPSLTDVRDISRSLARLERRVRDLHEQLQDLIDGAQDARR
jgi:hypothetical protein